MEPQNNTDEVKVNCSITGERTASLRDTTGYLNRGGSGDRNAGPSFIEIYEWAPGGVMTYQTTTTLDAA